MMVDSSGIPRGFDVGAMRRELAELKREVALLASRRNYVALDRIVEGGTIDSGVGDKLTETVQEKIVVNGENLSLDALDGRVITGSTVQTDVAPETGAKMTTAGFVAHGRAQVSPSTDTKVQSTLGARPAPDGGAGYIQPGLWIDATPDDGEPYIPPQYSAGVFAAEAFAGALGLRSARDTIAADYTQHELGPGFSYLISYGPEESPTTRARRETRVRLVYDGRFDVSAVGPGTPGYPGVVDAAVSHEGDGILHLAGRNGVDIEGDLTINGEPYTPGSGGGGPLEPDEDGILRLHGTNGVDVNAGSGPLRLDAWNGVNINGPFTINGQPYMPGGGGTTPAPVEDSGWRTATYQNGWMDYGNGFGGLQYRKRNGVLYLRGSIKGGANVTTVSNLPTDFRPVVPEGTTAMEFPIAVSQGGTWSSGVMYAYANGNLTYSANGATWTGFNRAVINAAFPL